jgi:hypothetical protein
MVFPVLAFAFGLLFYAASSALVTLTLQATGSWLWWSALVPLALFHAAAGFVATTSALAPLADQARTMVLCASTSTATSVLTLLVAIWCALTIPLPLSQAMAVLLVAVSVVAGLAGLVLAIRMPHRGVADPSRHSEN